jgi:hypothetical protein
MAPDASKAATSTRMQAGAITWATWSTSSVGGRGMAVAVAVAMA